MESPLTNHRTTRRKSPVEGAYVQNITKWHMRYVSRIVVIVVVIFLTKKIILYCVCRIAIERKNNTFIKDVFYTKIDGIR